jgi:hypothetical protein
LRKRRYYLQLMVAHVHWHCVLFILGRMGLGQVYPEILCLRPVIILPLLFIHLLSLDDGISPFEAIERPNIIILMKESLSQWSIRSVHECAASTAEHCTWSVDLSFLSTFCLFNFCSICCSFVLFSCLSYSSALKMEVVCSSEMFIDFTGLHVVKSQKMNSSGYSE